MKKPADTRFALHSLIAERWSPRSFDPRSVEPEKLGSLFEAARWAPSCFNEQPWSFLVATRDDEAAFDRLASCLMDGNAWAKQAPVLVLSVAKQTFERNGKPNRHAAHDVGLAVENLVLQAQAEGLVSHQMAGFDAAAATERLSLPEGCESMAMIAIGYPGEPEALSDELAERERAPRSRKELASFVFGAGWETAPTGLDL